MDVLSHFSPNFLPFAPIFVPFTSTTSRHSSARPHPVYHARYSPLSPPLFPTSPHLPPMALHFPPFPPLFPRFFRPQNLAWGVGELGGSERACLALPWGCECHMCTHASVPLSIVRDPHRIPCNVFQNLVCLHEGSWRWHFFLNVVVVLLLLLLLLLLQALHRG